MALPFQSRELVNTMSSRETASTYQRYKESTETFVTWLSRTAKACGWKHTLQTMPDQAKGPRLKGKARKSAKEASMKAMGANTRLYTVTTKQLRDQIDLVAKSKRISNPMPRYIYKALDTAIKQRKVANAWFEEAKSVDPASLEGHRYFVDILQRAIDKLPIANERENSNWANSKTNVSSEEKKVTASMRYGTHYPKS